MIVGDLLKFLQDIDPTTEIVIARDSYAMGSSQTGLYESGTELHKICEVKFMEADTLAGLGEFEEINRVEFREG